MISAIYSEDYCDKKECRKQRNQSPNNKKCRIQYETSPKDEKATDIIQKKLLNYTQ